MSTADIISRILETAANTGGDINSAIIAKYHESCPASAELMDHMDEHMIGRMMEQVFTLLMDDDGAELESYLTFETKNHEAYGARLYMYDNLLNAVTDVVHSLVGEEWTAEVDTAWRSHNDYLLREINRVSLTGAA